MDVMDAIRKRYSCRSYDNQPVPDETLRELLEAARLAPSARNLQDWRFVVVTEPEIREKLCKQAIRQEFVQQAPVIIVACSNNPYIMGCGQRIAPIDVAIAMEHLVLAATAKGLGTCWLGAFNPHKVRQILGIPSHIEVVNLLALGRPAKTAKSPDRLPIDHIVCKNRWIF
jgi:nitroreductase